MKLKMEFFLLIFLGMMANGALAQKRGAVWCFGDSAGIDFNVINNPIPFNSSLVTRGSCASVSNFSGNLLFYTNTRSGIGNPSGLVWNSNHELMVNGDSITGSGWYNEMVYCQFSRK
jgi:hypothetical protein